MDEYMDGSIEPELRGHVAILRLALSDEGRLTPATLKRLSADLDRLLQRSDLEALVLSGVAGRFGLGADHAAFVAEGAELLPATLFDRIADLDVPVVAAIDGLCLGLAAELALAARYRVAHVGTQFGFPDVLVGLPPMAGGTLRLPRLVGADKALTMLLTGGHVKGPGIQKAGLADLVVDGDVATAAVDFVRRQVSRGQAAAPAPYDENGGAFLRAVAQHRTKIAGSAIEAPARILECVEAGLLLPQEIYRNMQEVAFADLWASDHAKALIHIDRIERQAARLQRMIKPKARPLEKVAVAGTRGPASDLAVALLEAGFDVTVADVDDEALEAGVVPVIEHFDRRVSEGRITEEQAEEALDRMHAVQGFRTIVEADLVFDVVNLRGAASKSLIAQLDVAMKSGAVLATGSTQVGPDTIGTITNRPGDVVAVRFFGHHAERRLVEVAPGAATDPMALGTVLSLVRAMRRLPLVTGKNARGAGARMMAALHQVADHLLEQGASVALIDGVARSWGLPLGSFAERDAHGIVAPSPRTADPASSLGLDRILAAQERRGRAAGRGYYLYKDGKVAHDPDVQPLIDALRQRKGLRPRTVGADEVRLSLIAAMANAGAGLLADGTLLRPEQVDLLSVHGLGLARRAGGAMMSADLVGLERIRARLKALHEENPVLPAPQPIFRDLLNTGRRFADLNRPPEPVSRG